jgi:hypothetical protein
VIVNKPALVAGSVLLAVALAACSDQARPSAAPAVACASYPIQGAGAFHDEVRVTVTVTNAASAPANYQADVTIALASPAVGSMHVTVAGLIPAGASGTLSRKVLTASKARTCTISHLAQT